MTLNETLMDDVRLEAASKWEGMEVASLRDENAAVEALKAIRLQLEAAEFNRTKLVKPLNEHVRRINAEYRKLTESMEKADAAIRKAIVAFRGGAAFKEAEARHGKAVEAVLEAQSGNLPAEGLAPLVEECNRLAAYAPRTAGKNGELKFRKTPRMEVCDPDLVPREYMKVDDAKVMEAIRRGETVPGIRSWEETTTALGA